MTLHWRSLTTFFALLVIACASVQLPGPDEDAIEIRIRPGQSTRAIAESLKAQGIIRSPLEFRILARLTGRQGRLRSGLYRFRPRTEELTVLLALTRGGTTSMMITIPEGWTMQQIAAELDRRGICPAAEFLAACVQPELLHELDIEGPSAEGYLYPETYDFTLDTDPAAIIRQMTGELKRAWAELAGLDSARLPPLSVLTLASIVEREAARPDEFPLIASVFVNRLKKGMPLQSCATIEYVLPVRKPVLSIEDTRLDSPYNTYLHPGLPPGPIANPGRRALAAVFRPAETDFLYFFSRGDGSHVFSATWSEHQAARRRLQRDSADRD